MMGSTSWCQIPDIKQEILLITEEGKEEEAITRLARVGYDGVIGFLKGGFDTWKKAGKEVDTVKRITTADLEKIYNDQLPVFDVRKKSEFDSEHLIGAENVPLNQINSHLAQFPKEQPVYLHCAGGYRSMIAASILKQRGWENIADVRGGFDAIKESELPRSEYICPTTLL